MVTLVGGTFHWCAAGGGRVGGTRPWDHCTVAGQVIVSRGEDEGGWVDAGAVLRTVAEHAKFYLRSF